MVVMVCNSSLKRLRYKILTIGTGREACNNKVNRKLVTGNRNIKPTGKFPSGCAPGHHNLIHSLLQIYREYQSRYNPM